MVAANRVPKPRPRYPQVRSTGFLECEGHVTRRLLMAPSGRTPATPRAPVNDRNRRILPVVAPHRERPLTPSRVDAQDGRPGLLFMPPEQPFSLPGKQRSWPIATA